VNVHGCAESTAERDPKMAVAGVSYVVRLTDAKKSVLQISGLTEVLNSNTHVPIRLTKAVMKCGGRKHKGCPNVENECLLF
jgi:hypothetical protein